MHPTRRAVTMGLVATGLAVPVVAATDELTMIEASLGAGARQGVAAIDLASGRRLAHRGGERFAFCSTCKLPIAAAALAAIDAGRIDGHRTITVAPADIVDGPHGVVPGPATPLALCAAMMTLSDNTAANLLLAMVGGPAGLTRFMATHGGAPSRLDRSEPTLNTNLPGDPRDTTTPEAMLSFMRAVLVGHALSSASRERLVGWMVACTTGAKRLRAGLPASWRVGDKTGTGERGSHNDVAIAWPAPGRAPILIASYVDAPAASDDARNAAHAAVGRLVAHRLA